MPSSTSPTPLSPTPRSGAASPSPRQRSPLSPRPNDPALTLTLSFDSDLLRAYVKKLLQTMLDGMVWPSMKERERTKEWCREAGEKVKRRMLEIQPKGFKYVVLTRIDENAGQGGHANLACHWEDSDAVVQEMYTNDSLICVCVAFAIRTA